MRRTILVAIALVTVALPRLRAQLPLMPTSPRLQEIARLSQEGYGDSARKMMTQTLNRLATTDSGYPEALFTAALVAGNGDDASRFLKRIVVEFSTSAWADKAQLRLAQLSYGSGNMDDVITRVTRIFSDYPSSPVLPVAALWGARAALDQQRLQLGCDWITKGLAAAGDDIEVKNQLLFTKQRCNVGPGLQLAPMTPDSLRAGPPPVASTPDTAPRPATVPAAGKGPAAAAPWRVQVIAISDKAVVRRLTEKLTAAGYRTYEVAGPHGLTKVQAGPFATRAAAVAALAKVRGIVGGAPFVTQAP